jgi:hypothetical protein
MHLGSIDEALRGESRLGLEPPATLPAPPSQAPNSQPFVAPAMARFALPMLLLLAFAGLAGCTESDDGGDGPTTTGSTTTNGGDPDPCPDVDSTSTVSGWTAHGGEWGTQTTSLGPSVCGRATGAVQSLVRDSGTYSNLEANVSFEMLAGDSGAGLVIHYQDESNFNIIRYSPREQGWHLFTLIDGNRQKQDAASVTPPTTNPELEEWVALRVTSTDGFVEAWDGQTKVIEYELPDEASHQGRVGYFLRDSGMVALFDDFEVRAM